MPTILDFERPIRELEDKVSQLQSFSREHGVDVSHGVKVLEERIAEAKQKIFANLTPWQRVQLARHPDRPYPRDYVERLCTDFLELHGDRRFAEDRAIFGGFARMDGRAVMVIGTQKGRDLKENVRCNFGSAHPEGYRKALRLMRLAEKARVPIVSLIDTPGAYPGIGAEKRHIAEAIAVNLREMFRMHVPILVAVTGEGGSGGALGIGVGNRVLILENAYYSVITPEGCAAILWRDAAKAPQAAAALKLTSRDLADLEVVDEIVPEPLGGAHLDWDQAAELLGEALKRHLAELTRIPVDRLAPTRYARFRRMGILREG
ncbi:MAG: acetyl-CoA carboxylase carboxyltransferase subunit alpha [Kiritimatiellaeota bacterium]|nr:acetyl-CoA carboxylase carboxyltransferase subunit alpha [Kiritimatiellota bacterium]